MTLIRYEVVCESYGTKWIYDSKAVFFYKMLTKRLKEELSKHPDEQSYYFEHLLKQFQGHDTWTAGIQGFEYDYYDNDTKYCNIKYIRQKRAKVSDKHILKRGSSNTVFNVGDYIEYDDLELKIQSITHKEDGTIEYSVSHNVTVETDIEKTRLETVEEWMNHTFKEGISFEELKNEKDSVDNLISTFNILHLFKTKKITYKDLYNIIIFGRTVEQQEAVKEVEYQYHKEENNKENNLFVWGTVAVVLFFALILCILLGGN